MLKMTGLDVLFAAAGNLYLLLVLAGVCAAFWMGKTWARKLTYAALVLAIFIAPVAPEIYRTIEYRSKLAKATALFEERCKTAGEKIYKTVADVDGVLLMKVRSDKINFSDQYAMDDPFGADCHGQSCIADLLRDGKNVKSTQKNAVDRDAGFNWVEVVDAADDQLYRYIGITKFHPSGDSYFVTAKTKITSGKARFGVTYDDISTREDRALWIAGGSLKVIDLTTKEIIAERIGFMIDLEQGNTDGGRSPWAFAYDNACPKFPTVSDGRAYRSGHTRKFVFSVLHSEKTK